MIFETMQIIHKQLLDHVSGLARENARLRKNFNFHEGDESASQRLLNALEPGTVLPVHRHMNTDETYVLLRGRLKVIFYNDKKNVTDCCTLDPLSGMYGVNIPAGQWHTIEILAPDTVIFECKDGPYAPLNSEDIL